MSGPPHNDVFDYDVPILSMTHAKVTLPVELDPEGHLKVSVQYENLRGGLSTVFTVLLVALQSVHQQLMKQKG